MVFHVCFRFRAWDLCQFADNTSGNKKLAKIPRIFHVCSLNHKLYSDVKDTIQIDRELSATIMKVHENMRICLGGMTNSRTLRSLTILTAILPREKCWSGKRNMITRFNRIREELI